MKIERADAKSTPLIIRTYIYWYHNVVSIEFSPFSTVDLTTNWYQLHNGDYG